jgi:hypothetical protein
MRVRRFIAALIASKMYRPSGDAMIPFDNSPANKFLLDCRWAVDLRGSDARVKTAWKENAFVYSRIYSYMIRSVLLRLGDTDKPDHVECHAVAAIRKSSRYRE